MSDQFCGIEAEKAFHDPLALLGACMAKVLPEGPVGTALLWVVVLCVALAPFIFKYYLGVLAQGAQPEGSLERRDYDALRAGLAGDNLAARLYSHWLKRFLDAIDRFFKDAGMADHTLFPHAFGLKTPAPLWTAPAFDRCLFLALIYPIATIFLIWAIFDHVGPAEAALGLTTNVSGMSRGLGVAAIGFSSFAFRRAALTPGWKRLLWFALTLIGASAAAPAEVGVVLVTFAVAFARAGAGAGAGTFAGAFAVAFAVAVVGVGASSGIFAGALAADIFVFAFIGAFFLAVARVRAVALAGFFTVAGAVGGVSAVAVAGASASALAGIVAVTIAIAVGVLLLNKRAIKQGVFQSLFVPPMIVACLLTAKVSDKVGPLLLFQGLLTLLNAPFDWASLGLTRALLRRGLELKGWWPYLLGLVDAALASLIIASLALVMVAGVQAFDELAVHGGSKPVLPLDALFDGIKAHPAAPEYWWAYALLLSSMIPSIVNLAIGGMALTRGIPWLARLLLQWMPEGRAMPEYRRQLAAIGLTVQMFAGVGLGIAAQAFLVWGLIFHVMPWIGLDLLDVARAVAAFDVPMRIGQLFRGTT